MKKVLSLLLLVGVLGCISWFTYYTLHNKGIREEAPSKPIKQIERVTQNINNSGRFEIYNVYLNGQRHKVKVEYSVSISEEKIALVYLTIFLDGKSILNELVMSEIKVEKVEDLFLLEDFINHVEFREANINILKGENNEYLVMDVGYFNEVKEEKYFAFNEVGDKVIDGVSRVVRNEYVDKEGNDLNIFYEQGEDKSLAIIKEDSIYAFMIVEKNKKKNILEYKYTFKKEKVVVEVIKTYEDVKIKEGTVGK